MVDTSGATSRRNSSATTQIEVVGEKKTLNLISASVVFSKRKLSFLFVRFFFPARTRKLCELPHVIIQGNRLQQQKSTPIRR